MRDRNRAGEEGTVAEQDSGSNGPTDRRARERRNATDDSKWIDQRSGQDRRASEDRRGIHYSVPYTNPEAVEKLREWLQEHCRGRFEIGIADMAEVRKWGKFRVRFELQEDRTKLARLLGVHWPKWMG